MLELYEPHIEDLWFKKKMMDDEQTMAYNHAYGGTIPFPKEKWTNWHQRWITDHSGKRFYRYIQDNDALVGEVAYYFDEERQIRKYYRRAVLPWCIKQQLFAYSVE